MLVLHPALALKRDSYIGISKYINYTHRDILHHVIISRYMRGGGGEGKGYEKASHRYSQHALICRSRQKLCHGGWGRGGGTKVHGRIYNQQSRERQRARHRERDRDREREGQRQRERGTETQREGQRQRERDRDRERGTETEREATTTHTDLPYVSGREEEITLASSAELARSPVSSSVNPLA